MARMTTTQSGPTRTGSSMIGGPEQVLTDDEITQFVRAQLDARDLDGRSVCLVIPDGTRSCPLPLLLSAVHGALAGRVTRLTALVALGTHAPMDEAHLAKMLGYPVERLEDSKW